MCSKATKEAFRLWSWQRKKFIRCLLLDAMDCFLVPLCKLRQRLYNWTIFEARITLSELLGTDQPKSPDGEVR